MDVEFIDITTFKAIVTCDIHLVSGPQVDISHTTQQFLITCGMYTLYVYL